MPAKDLYHDIVKKALVKDGWNITHNPLHLRWGTKDLYVGRDNFKRVHGALLDLDIIDGKIWIQRDGTEDGIATDLLAAGIPKDKIVLAFYSEEIRQHSEFAVN